MYYPHFTNDDTKIQSLDDLYKITGPNPDILNPKPTLNHYTKKKKK